MVDIFTNIHFQIAITGSLNGESLMIIHIKNPRILDRKSFMIPKVEPFLWLEHLFACLLLDLFALNVQNGSNISEEITTNTKNCTMKSR